MGNRWLRRAHHEGCRLLDQLSYTEDQAGRGELCQYRGYVVLLPADIETSLSLELQLYIPLHDTDHPGDNEKAKNPTCTL